MYSTKKGAEGEVLGDEEEGKSKEEGEKNVSVRIFQGGGGRMGRKEKKIE